MKPLHVDMKETKFKIGDKCKVIDCSMLPCNCIGKTVTLESIHEEGCWVKGNTQHEWFSFEELQLLKVKKPVKKEKCLCLPSYICSIHRLGSPKPLKQSKIPKCKMSVSGNHKFEDYCTGRDKTYQTSSVEWYKRCFYCGLFNDL